LCGIFLAASKLDDRETVALQSHANLAIKTGSAISDAHHGGNHGHQREQNYQSACGYDDINDALDRSGRA